MARLKPAYKQITNVSRIENMDYTPHTPGKAQITDDLPPRIPNDGAAGGVTLIAKADLC